MLGRHLNNTDLRSRRDKGDKYDISVIIPLFNEEGNVTKMFTSISEALRDSKKSFELIYVNDGSNDGSAVMLEDLHRKNSNVSVIHLYRKCGKAPALELGIEFATGNYIVIIDCDLQYDANDIPKMITELENGNDVVSGRRTHREDCKRMIITSRLFNWIVRKITGLKIKDYFSGLKCFKKDVIAYLSLFGDLYRFASVYAHKQGFLVKEIPVKHYRRVHGKSRYSTIRRLGMAMFDIMTIMFTVTFNQKRVYYFGFMGLVLSSVGIFLLYAWFLLNNADHQGMAKYASYIGFTMLFLGAQILVVKQISKDFFVRHHETFYKRRRNIRKILSH